MEITDAAAFPQDYAAAMTVYQRIAEFNKVITVDIGGFTLDYLLIRGGRPDLGVCDSQGTGGSFEKGVIKLYNDVASRINSEKDILLETRTSTGSSGERGRTMTGRSCASLGT